MVRNLNLLLIICLLLISCGKDVNVEEYINTNEKIFLKVVEKKIIEEGSISGIYAEELKASIIKWLDSEVKVNGFEGRAEIILKNITADENLIENGISINARIDMNLIIFTKSKNKKETIKLQTIEYGELTGLFSLNDKSILLNNIINRLIERLSKDLKAKLA